MNDEQIDKLLSEIDDIARDVDLYEYGLPIMNTRATKKMHQAVRNWLLQQSEAIVSADLLTIVIPEEWYK